MSTFVLLAWLVQAAAGVRLLLAARRHGGAGAPSVLVHVGLSVAGLAAWVAFVGTAQPGWGWLAFAVMTVGNGVGDSLLVRRSRRADGGAAPSGAVAYGRAIRAVFAGRLPRLVTFHALFAGVVYFTALAACLAA